MKIDGSFVKGMLLSPVDYAMVEAIHQVARRISLKTVAEFVETTTNVAVTLARR